MASADTESVSLDDARREVAAGDATAVDVRSEEKWSAGHVPGAVHLPDGETDEATNKPEEGARVIVIGENEKQAKEGASKLAEVGYDAVALDGGMGDWTSEDYPIQPTEDPDDDSEMGRN
jgi:rhodanese-related sulfurtransferase